MFEACRRAFVAHELRDQQLSWSGTFPQDERDYEEDETEDTPWFCVTSKLCFEPPSLVLVEEGTDLCIDRVQKKTAAKSRQRRVVPGSGDKTRKPLESVTRKDSKLKSRSSDSPSRKHVLGSEKGERSLASMEAGQGRMELASNQVDTTSDAGVKGKRPSRETKLAAKAASCGVKRRVRLSTGEVTRKWLSFGQS